MGYSGERRGFSSPLNIGETYNVTIEDVGREGDGIARVEGFVVFVPNTKKGDSVKIRVTKVSRRVAFAEVVAE
ncbi:MAG TPA: TRAM domain-containing protein [Desulfobacteria bacterium]|nr:TRAM domain-containing protein [Desulfobacteria bacterium]